MFRCLRILRVFFARSLQGRAAWEGGTIIEGSFITWPEFLVISLGIALSILACRVVPLFLLRGRKLDARAKRALGLIPPAVFAALVANDLLAPDMFDASFVLGSIPLLAAIVVAIAARKTRSLLLCVIVGVSVYALLLFVL